MELYPTWKEVGRFGSSLHADLRRWMLWHGGVCMGVECCCDMGDVKC